MTLLYLLSAVLTVVSMWNRSMVVTTLRVIVESTFVLDVDSGVRMHVSWIITWMDIGARHMKLHRIGAMS